MITFWCFILSKPLNADIACWIETMFAVLWINDYIEAKRAINFVQVADVVFVLWLRHGYLLELAFFIVFEGLVNR